jgi:hypothetical protein
MLGSLVGAPFCSMMMMVVMVMMGIVMVEDSEEHDDWFSVNPNCSVAHAACYLPVWTGL